VRRAAAVGLVLLTGCHDATKSQTAPDLPTAGLTAALTVSIDTNPITSTSNPNAPYMAQWDVVIQETAGVGVDIIFLNTTIRDATSGALATPMGLITLAGTVVAQQVGTSHIPPHGSITVPQSLQYALVSGGSAISLIIGVQGRDDGGHIVSGWGQATLD